MKKKWTGRKGYDKNEWYGITETGYNAWDANTGAVMLKNAEQMAQDNAKIV